MIFSVNDALTKSLASTLQILTVNGLQSSRYAEVTDLLFLPSPLLLLLIVVIVLFLVVAPLSVGGAYYRNVSMIWAAAGIILLLLLLHLAIATVFISRMADDTARGLMVESIKYHYIATDANDTYSTAWDVLHQKLGCCGVQNYTDFNRAIQWKRRRWLYSQIVTLQTPFSCCRPTSTSYSCATNPTDKNSFYLTGCYEKSRLLLIGNTIGVLLVLGLTLIAPVMTIIRLAKDTS